MTDTLISGVQSVFKAAREAEAQKAAQAAESAKAAEPKQLTHAFKALGVDEFGVITGIGGAAGDANKLDLDGEFVSKADLTTMAFDFCAGEKRVFKANHTDELGADLVASWVGAPIVQDGDCIRVLKADESLTKEMTVVGISTEKGAETHWFIGVRPHDPAIVEAAKAGEVAGFSWSCPVVKKAVA